MCPALGRQLQQVKDAFAGGEGNYHQETRFLYISRLCERCSKAYLSATEHSEHHWPFSAHKKKVQRVKKAML